MSIHKDCGENIRWAKSPNDESRWMPPMEYAGEGFWIDEDQVGHHVHIYQPHICDPEKMKAWREHLERIAEITGDESDAEKLAEVDIRAARREADQESARAAAQQFECPNCGAGVGERCISKAAESQGGGKPTLWPHPRRLELSGWREQRG